MFSNDFNHLKNKKKLRTNLKQSLNDFMNNLEIEKNQIYLAVVPKKKYNDFNGHF